MKKVTLSFNVPTFSMPNIPSVDVTVLKDAASAVLVDTTSAARGSVARQLSCLASYIEPSKDAATKPE